MAPIRRLDQIRALAHPLRLRILESLVGEARTPKQVAEKLGRKPTSLYHHVRILESAGLVRQIATRKKRGTVEKYFRATLDEVRVDPGIFAGRRSGMPALVAGVLDATQDEVRRLRSPSDPVVALRLRVPVSRSRVKELERVLRKWAASAAGRDATEYSLTLVAYPQPARQRSTR